jgi:hypothetical protein
MTERVTKWLGCGLVLFPAGVTNVSLFQTVQNGSGAHTDPYSVGTGITGRGVKSATHLYVVPKLRTSGVIPPLLIRVRGMDMDCFTFCCG